MKAFALIGAVVAGGLIAASSASAADLAARPYTKAPPLVAVYDWSGFYIGANGGYGSARKCWDIVTLGGVAVAGTPREGCHDADGGTVGGQVGYRWQSAQWVFGLEGQGNWADFRGSNVSTFLAPAGIATNRSRIDSFGMFTGQVGYAWNSVLLYVKGGGAVVADRYAGLFTAGGIIFDRARETRGGGVIGLGLEFGITPNVTLGVNYDHMLLGDRTLAFTTPAGVIDRSDRIRQDVDMVTARINYRWGGPVVAKY